jgi:hypothetical protein
MRRIVVLFVLVVALGVFFFLPFYSPPGPCNRPGVICAEQVRPIESASCAVTGVGTYIPSNLYAQPVIVHYRLGCINYAK